MRVAIGALMHESNTFAPGLTTLADFRRTQFLTGPAIVEAHAGTGSEVGGALEALQRHGAEIVPTLSAWAMPSPLVERSAYLKIRGELLRRLGEAGPLDGILLCLHGSMTAEGIEDPEGDLLRRVRGRWPETPLAVTLDHHANVTETMVAASDVLVGYRTHPHVDQLEVGRRAADHLVERIDGGEEFVTAFVKLPLITPAENRSEPIDRLRAEAEEIDQDPAVVCSSFYVGYPWADVSIQGAAVSVTTRNDPALARACARRLAAFMWSLRGQFRFPIHPVEEAVRMGREVEGRPVVLDELADCTLGGASGDVVSTARYLYERAIGPSAAVGVVDAVSAPQAAAAGPGAPVRLSIGGRVCTEDNPPLEFAGTVRSVHRDVHGRTSIHSGYETPVGAIAVVEGRGLSIVLIERAGKLGGPTFLEEVGLDPRSLEFIVVKEGLNPLVTYRDVAALILMVDSPGFDRQIPRPRDYSRLRRPVYPLDPGMSWEPEG